MAMQENTQAEVSRYISALFRQRVGKGPASVYVTINSPFILIYFRGFLTPMEKVLLNQQERNQILETRDILIDDLRPEITQKLQKVAEMNISEFYADWNLETETGMMLGVVHQEASSGLSEWPSPLDKNVFHKIVNEKSKKAEKKPDKTESYWLNDHILIVKRSKIFVEIEKELIRNDFTEALKLAKRPLESRLLTESKLEKVLKRKINDIFLDWNFEEDIGYLVIILEPHKKG